MELRHLRYFTAVIECNGFREASRLLRIAQPALSQTVIDLEDELAVQLIERRRRAIVLTPAGSVFYVEAKAVLAQAESAAAAAKRTAKGEIGSLSVAFIPAAVAHFLPELLKAFSGSHPGVELIIRELTPARQMESFKRNQLDLAFTRELTAEQMRTYSSFTLFDVPLVAVLPASRNVPEGTIQLRELADDNFILLDRTESCSLFDSIVNLCKKEGFSPRFHNTAYLAESILTLVRAEAGISVVPSWAKSFGTDGLQMVRLLPDLVRVELSAAWRTESQSILLMDFINLLKLQLAEIQEKTRQLFG